MDEFTRERYGPVIPYHEAYARPNPLPWAGRWRDGLSHDEWVRRNRIALCGTADLSVEIQGGDVAEEVKNRRLLEAIRKWKDGLAA